MKRSIFNIVTEKKNEKRALIYNTFSDSQVLLDDKCLLNDFFNKIDTHTDLTAEEKEWANQFLELGFLVDDDVNEKEKFLEWFETKVRNNYEQLSCLILTSRTCNLRCPYCFEKDVLAKGLNMSVETARQVIAWNKARIDTHHPQKLDLTFFGGEPLMNIPVLELIASELSQFCEQNGVAFEFGMITNGVLLTRDLCLKLRDIGLKWVKITIDGDKEAHDKLRVTASGRGTFDKIWQNLSAIQGIIPLYIGGNFNATNQDSLYALVDKLGEAKFRENIFSVEFKPIMENFSNTTTKKERPIRTDFAESAFGPKQADLMMNVRGYIQDKNLPNSTQIGMGPCELHRKSYFGIDMNGKLYKCSAMIGHEEFASGDIWQGEDEKKVVERMGEGIRPWKDCGECPYIPVCAGGCKAVGYDKYGDFTIGSCDKYYFNRMVGEMFERNLAGVQAYNDGLQIDQAPMHNDFLIKTLDANFGGMESFSV